jgi:hypothetical protein
LKVLRTVGGSIYVLDCLSLYFWMISWLTVSAVLRKYERVHSDGSFFREGNSSRKSCELCPLMSRGMSDGSVEGLARMNRWT